LKGKIGALSGVVGGIRSEDPSQMLRADDRYAIQALAPYQADEML
jgi:hypothetical protein